MYLNRILRQGQLRIYIGLAKVRNRSLEYIFTSRPCLRAATSLEGVASIRTLSPNFHELLGAGRVFIIFVTACVIQFRWRLRGIFIHSGERAGVVADHSELILRKSSRIIAR